MEDSKRIIEINGIKAEIDLRTIKKIEAYRVGQPVKVLVKGYSDYQVHPGVIVSVDPFEALPTINVAYIPNAWGAEGKIEFKALNSASTGIEICAIDDDDILPSRESVVDMFDRAIEKERQKLADLESRKAWFLRLYSHTVETAKAKAAND